MVAYWAQYFPCSVQRVIGSTLHLGSLMLTTNTCTLRVLILISPDRWRDKVRWEWLCVKLCGCTYRWRHLVVAVSYKTQCTDTDYHSPSRADRGLDGGDSTIAKRIVPLLGDWQITIRVCGTVMSAISTYEFKYRAYSKLNIWCYGINYNIYMSLFLPEGRFIGYLALLI